MKINKLYSLCIIAPFALSVSTIIPATGTQTRKTLTRNASIIPDQYLEVKDGVLYGLAEGISPAHIYEYDTLQIPESVVEIAPYAFAYLFDSAQTKITNIDFSKAISLQKIGDNAFNYCHGLTCDIDLTQNPQLKYIGKNCFFYCFGIKSILLNNQVTDMKIADHAFFQCSSIENLTIPNGVVDIGNNAFEKCTGLKKINLSEFTEFPKWLLSSSWIFNQAGPNKVNDDESPSVIVYYNGISPTQWAAILQNRQNLSKSWTITSKRPTNVDDFTYSDGETKHVISGLNGIPTSIDALVIPDEVTEISDNAFKDSFKVTRRIPVILNKNLKKIGANAFSGCTALYGDLELPYQLESIGNAAFKGCTNLSGNVVIPDGVTKLNDEVFNDSGITGVTFHDGVEALGKNVFTNCDKLSWIDVSAFRNHAPDWQAQSKTGDQPFYGLNDNGAIFMFSDSIKSEWLSKFMSLGMTDNITDVGTLSKWTLNARSDVSSFVFPDDGFTSIDQYNLMGFRQAFASPEVLNEYGQIKTPLTTLSIAKEAFKGKLRYFGVTYWRLFLNEGLQTIKDSAFEGDTGLYGNLVLPHTIKEIGARAFYGCVCLQGKLSFPRSKPIIGTDAFSGTNLSGYEFPENLTLVSDNAFVINSANKTLDFSKISSIDALKFSPWIKFETGAQGTIVAKNKIIANQLFDYFIRLQEKFDIGFNQNNWKIVEGK